MTDQTSPFSLRETVIDAFVGNSLIAAADHYVSALQAGSLEGRLESATLLPVAPDAPLSDVLLSSARVLVLEVDADSSASMRRLAGIRASHPNLVIIAALKQADVSLVRTLIRQGVADVAELPFNAAQLEEQILDALSDQLEVRTQGDLGKVIAVVGASGGCGATSILTHLAAALAEKNNGHRGVCLIDLDLQKGSAASYLGLEPVVTVQALIDAGARLDNDLMMSAVTDTGQGYSLIAAPDTISPVDRIDIDHMVAIINLARAAFDYVLIDLPPVWTNWTLSMITWADRVLLLTDSSIAGLRQAKRTLNLLGDIDVPRERVSVVVNRVERRVFGATRVSDVTRALGNATAVGVCDAGPALRSAQDQGLLLPALQGKTRFATDVSLVADAVASGQGGLA